MPADIIPLPPLGAEEHTRAETERKRQLFAWADRVLQELGLVERVARASNFNELRKIVFDANAPDVELAIRDALHPASGGKAEYFQGLREGHLKRILRSRFDDAKKQREADLLRGRQGGRQQSTPDWAAELKLDKDGGVLPILSNYILYLTNHKVWKGVLGLDQFSNRVVIRKAPPWGEEELNAQWTDHHETLTRRWFQNEDIKAPIGDFGRAVQAAARSNPFHPAREYFDALRWDGTPRLDQWLVTYLGSQDSEYSRAIGPRFMISGVARVHEPGCKVDHTLILEGPQGKLKSEALRTVAIRDAWFSDRLSHMASKDAAIEVAGVLLFEIAELDALTRVASSTAKGFLTRRYDRFRPPYGKHPVNVPRQCVFAGTINPPPEGYLKDPTGARRFWPVKGGTINLETLRADRDQLWAEAVARYRAGEKWWLEKPALEALAASEQKLRFKTDVWTQPIRRWLGQRRKDVSLGEALQGALGIKPRKGDELHSAEVRVANILKNLGFKRYLANRGGKRQKRYRRDQ
jgi:predicted P-loop ATPase